MSSRAADARASADVFVSSARNVHSKRACAAVHDPLASVGTLAGRLASDPKLAPRLAPQVTSAVAALARAAAGSSAEWREVLEATDSLGDAVRQADETTVRLTASQVVLAVKLAQAGCSIAGH